MHSRLSAQTVICAALVLALAATVLAQEVQSDAPLSMDDAQSLTGCGVLYKRNLIHAGKAQSEEPG